MIDPGIDHLERMLERADYLRDERRDAAWERALERDAGPWDERDAFSLAKEAKFFEEERSARETAVEAPEKAPDALASRYGTDSHRHDSNES